MEIYTYECLECEKEWAVEGSKFCSPACRDKFAVKSNGPVRCDNCEAETETIAEALAADWKDVHNTPEGSCWNQQGTCPACQNVA